MLVVAGCGSGGVSSGTDTALPDDSGSAAPEARGSGLFPKPARTSRARVTGVSDGDTISLSGLGKVRLIGIDTPEVYGGAECFGAEASAYTKRLLPHGTRVRYRLGVEERDRYGRALAYVWLRDGRFVNGLLVLNGYATALTIAPNVDYAAAFRRAARIARRRGRGLWKRGCGGNPGRKPCSDFETQEQAQRYFEGPGTAEFGTHDGDGDGRVCESLP